MANSWTGDVEDNGDDAEEGFATKLQGYVDSGKAADIDELELVSNIDEVDDVDLLKQAYRQLESAGHDEKETIVENRIHDLDAAVPPGETEQASLDETAKADDPDAADSGEEGGESEEPAITSLAEEDDQDPSGETETAPEPSEASSGPPEPSDAMTPSQAGELERRWKVMCFGPPKLFKTHFGFTMPEPIAFIDLEGKADDLAGKFEGKDVRIWQPKRMTAEPDTKFRRAKKALDQALEWLRWYRENEGRRGTIVVDSMSLLWEWAQVHHKLENFPMKDPEDIELSANFQSSAESDWAVIKEYHNGEFRERITDSPYHFYWTAMERVDFEETMEDEDNTRIMEPKGEPDNDYKVDTVLHARSDPNDDKVADLVGSNFTDNRFVGLPRPTFPKVKETIEAIEDAEASDDSIARSDLADEIGVQAVIRYNPQRYGN